MASPTWQNLYTGYSIYEDVATNHPFMYTDASQKVDTISLYDEFIKQLPTDLTNSFGIFFSSIVILTLFTALFFNIFMPFFKRPQRW